jgi:hypothetical protein
MTRVELVAQQAGRTSDGMELRLRSPWYRSLPLSSIDVRLTLDSADVAPERIRFCINDRDYTLEELRERFEEFWFVLDAARLRVSAVEPGHHDVDLGLALRIPYLFDEETGDVLVIRSTARLTVRVPEAPMS